MNLPNRPAIRIPERRLRADPTATETQFVVEAAAIGPSCGIAGIGIGSGRLLSSYLQAPMIVSGEFVFWVTVAAAGAGVIFGDLHAHQASALDPIQAVQAES